MANFSNPNALSSDSTAWTVTSNNESDYLFVKVHTFVTMHLLLLASSVTGTSSVLRFVTKAPPSAVFKLWKQQDARTLAQSKNWSIALSVEAPVAWTYRASEFTTAEQFAKFVNFDHRLVLCSIPTNVFTVLNVPRKRFEFEEIAPPSLVDSTSTVANWGDLQANYTLWVNFMKVHHSGIPVLEDVFPGITATYLKQVAVFPMRDFAGDGKWNSFVLVFIPAFNPMFEKEHRNYCSVHILGRMMFGESYRLGGDFDLRLIGYFFAVPKTMLKAVSAEPFFLRCCGSFRKVNWSSNQPVPFEGRVTMNLSPGRPYPKLQQAVCSNYCEY